MNDTAIVSCFYTNLHGTKYGGRQDREHHYLNSIVSLLKITNADFFIYCDPLQEPMLSSFIEPIAKTKVTIFRYNLEDFYMKTFFDEYKNYDHAKLSDRCQEIQYLKTHWMNDVDGYDWKFWIDAGISYSGLIPDKHLIFPDNAVNEYYNSDLFCDDLINGMKKFADDKFLMFSINNHFPVPYRKLISDVYHKEHEQISHHAIAGVLGGKKRSVENFHKMFTELASEIIIYKKEVYDEECIYNILLQRYPELFSEQKFETWWHEDNLLSIFKDDYKMIEKVKSLRAFYRVLEDLIAIGKQP